MVTRTEIQAGQVSPQAGNFIVLNSGTPFYFDDIQSNVHIYITDIGHHLSQMARFGGATRDFYSVAQHSVLVARIIDKLSEEGFIPPALLSQYSVNQLKFMGLMHDATEYVTQDMVSPLKRKLPEYKDIENQVWSVIAREFDLPEDLPPLIKTADLIALAAERRDLCTKTSHHWSILDNLPTTWNRPIVPMVPQDARLYFLDEFQNLKLCIKDEKANGRPIPPLVAAEAVRA